MASVQSVPNANFSIYSPLPGSNYPPDGNNSIAVSGSDTSNTSIIWSIFDWYNGLKIIPAVGSGSFSGGITTFLSSTCVENSMSPPGGSKMFCATDGSNNNLELLFSALHSMDRHGPKDQLIPAVVHLRLDGAVQADTQVANHCLNRRTALIHSQDPAYPGHFLSQPLDWGDGTNPAYWVLEMTKNGLLLSLRRAAGDQVQYKPKARENKKAAFPAKLWLTRKSSGEAFEKYRWPQSVTISLTES